MDWLRWAGPLAVAAITAIAIDQLTRARGLDPPGFASLARRTFALLLLAGILAVGVFLPLGQIGLPRAALDFDSVPPIQLFALHAMLLVVLALWFMLGFAGVPASRGLAATGLRQLGMWARNPLKELGIGFGLGILLWPMLLVVVGLALVFLVMLGMEDVVPAQPPEMVVWIVSLPIALKIGIAVSAGVVEEVFFRGFLQPRIGVGLSTLLFVLAHMSYDQPFMLVGITFLSLFFSLLVWWRQNIWAAVAAHFLFDLVQLLVVIPKGLEGLGPIADGAAMLGLR